MHSRSFAFLKLAFSENGSAQFARTATVFFRLAKVETLLEMPGTAVRLSHRPPVMLSSRRHSVLGSAGQWYPAG